MSRQRRSKPQTLVRASADALPAAGKRGRWPLVLVAVIGLAAGAAIVERLTRPGPVPSVEDARAPQPGGQDRALVAPPPARPGGDELVAEVSQLADELVESFPNDSDALAFSGRVSFAFPFGDLSKAKVRWEQSVKLDPKSAEAWLGLAELARQEGDFRKAVECMHRLAEARPDWAREKVFYLADSLLKLGKAREAVHALEETGKTAALPGWARVLLGQGYSQLNNHHQAAEHYRKALDDPQQAGAACYGLSQALMRLGRRDEARKYREEYARRQEKNMVVYDRMHLIGTDMERNDPVPWYPVLSGFHCEAGRLYARRGERERAEQHWLRAWALSPDRPEPRQLLESLDRQPDRQLR